MRSPATTSQAAPTQGAAPTATEQRALATLARLDEQAAQAASRRISYCLAPASAHDEPATDPARWLGFI